MDYRIFHRDNNYPTTLNTEEIEQPYQALQAFLADIPCEVFRQDLENLLYAQFKPFGWKEYGAPANLYRTCYNVKKLLDILWLINTCCKSKDLQPELSYTERRKMQQYYRRSFKGLFNSTPTDIEELPQLDPYLTLVEFFNDISLTVWKNSINLWAYMALSSSYMFFIDEDFFGVGNNTLIRDYRCISGIISAAYQLEPVKLDTAVMQRLSFFKIFATDIDHPQSFEEMEIKEPRMVLNYVHFYMDSRQLPEVINTWRGMLASTDHWHYHTDPGNVIFIKENLVMQIETAWMLLLIEGDKTHRVRSNAKLVNPDFFPDLNMEEQSDPFSVIEQFFDSQNLCVWTELLEDWIYGSLTDKNEKALLNSRVTEKTCNQLIKLLQALYLINKRFD